MQNKSLETLELFEDISNLSRSKLYSTRQYAENKLIEFYRDNKWLLNNPLDTDKIDLMEINLRTDHFNTFVKYCVLNAYNLIIYNKITTNNDYMSNDHLVNYLTYKCLSKFEDCYFKVLSLNDNAYISNIDQLINVAVKTISIFLYTATNLDLYIHNSKYVFVTKCLQE